MTITVRDLITKLQQFDPDLQVVIEDMEVFSMDIQQVYLDTDNDLGIPLVTIAGHEYKVD